MLCFIVNFVTPHFFPAVHRALKMTRRSSLFLFEMLLGHSPSVAYRTVDAQVTAAWRQVYKRQATPGDWRAGGCPAVLRHLMEAWGLDGARHRRRVAGGRAVRPPWRLAMAPPCGSGGLQTAAPGAAAGREAQARAAGVVACDLLCQVAADGSSGCVPMQRRRLRRSAAQGHDGSLPGGPGHLACADRSHHVAGGMAILAP